MSHALNDLVTMVMSLIVAHYELVAIAFVLFWAAFIVQSAFGLSPHKARTYDQRKY